MAVFNQAQQYDVIGAKGVIGYYFQNLDQLTGLAWTPKVANTFESTMDTETYGGLGMVPQLREWLGGKQLKSLIESSLKITNKDFESTLRIKNKDRRRDKTGQVNARMGQLAERALAHDAKLLSVIINNGTTTTNATAYDGLALYSASHLVGTTALNNNISVTIANLATGGTGTHGTTTAPSVGEMALSIMQGIQQMYGFLDDQGEPINEMAREFIVMVPPSLSGVAQAAVNSAFFALGMNNPIQYTIAPSGMDIKVSIVINPRLTGTANFFIFRTDGFVKSLIIQLEVAPMVKTLDTGSDNEFFNNELLVSVEKSGNVGIGRFDQTVNVTMV